MESKYYSHSLADKTKLLSHYSPPNTSMNIKVSTTPKIILCLYNECIWIYNVIGQAVIFFVV